MNVSPELLQAL